MSIIGPIQEGEKLDINGNVGVPAMMLPAFRYLRAKSEQVDGNVLLCTQGGLGDVICAEPSIRYAVKKFTDCEVSLATYFPELFGHLKFKEVINLKDKLPDYEKYFVFDTLFANEHLHWEFMIHNFMHVVDYHSLAMFKTQLPVADKSIRLDPTPADYNKIEINKWVKQNDVVIHAGRTWQSRTVPSRIWNGVIRKLVEHGFRPVLIGKETYGMVGNLQVEKEGCLDLRDKLSLMETVALLHMSRVLLTNDSSPLHMAASGDAWIGFVSTVKFPEYLMHWRDGKFGWKMENHSKGGLWEIINMTPRGTDTHRLDIVDQKNLDSWMPDPKVLAEWAMERWTIHP